MISQNTSQAILTLLFKGKGCQHSAISWQCALEYFLVKYSTFWKRYDLYCKEKNLCIMFFSSFHNVGSNYSIWRAIVFVKNYYFWSEGNRNLHWLWLIEGWQALKWKIVRFHTSIIIHYGDYQTQWSFRYTGKKASNREKLTHGLVQYKKGFFDLLWKSGKFSDGRWQVAVTKG